MSGLLGAADSQHASVCVDKQVCNDPRHPSAPLPLCCNATLPWLLVYMFICPPTRAAGEAQARRCGSDLQHGGLDGLCPPRLRAALGSERLDAAAAGGFANRGSPPAWQWAGWSTEKSYALHSMRSLQAALPGWPASYSWPVSLRTAATACCQRACRRHNTCPAGGLAGGHKPGRGQGSTDAAGGRPPPHHHLPRGPHGRGGC